MANRNVFLGIPVRGDLNTADPAGDLPFGTLVEAVDVAPRWWGPRRGSLSFTRAWEGPGTGTLYNNISLDDGADTYGTGSSYDEEFRDLGTQWTLDIWFRLSETSYATGMTKIGLYKFVVDARGIIEVAVSGPDHATPNRILVRVSTTPDRSSVDTAVSFTGDAQFSVGTGQTDKHHVRLVRDGANLNLYTDGIDDGSADSLVATSGLLGAAGSQALVGIGKLYAGTAGELATTLKGKIFGAVLRDGAFTSAPIESVMPCAPWARNVHHYYLGRNVSFGGDDHFFDASRFGAHARISGSGYTVTAANDDTAPASCIVQGMRSWTTRTNRTASTVVAGGVISTLGVQ